jgi:MFS family permease
VAGKLSDRLGARWLMGGGMALVSASLVLFSLLNEDSSFWNLFPALLVGGAGMAMAMTPTTAAAMAAVPVDKAGVGSGVLNSMRQVGGSLGIAVMGAIVAAGVKTSLADGEPRPVAFVNGFHHALDVAALIALAGAVIAFATLGGARHQPEAVVSEAKAA